MVPEATVQSDFAGTKQFSTFEIWRGYVGEGQDIATQVKPM